MEVLGLALTFFALGMASSIIYKDYKLSVRLASISAFLGSIFVFITAIEGIKRRIELELFKYFFPIPIEIDPLASFFLLTIGFIGAVNSLYSLKYMERFDRRAWLYALAYNGALASSILFVSTSNIERFTLFYELLALFSFILIVWDNSRISVRYGWIYFITTQIFGVIPLLLASAIAFTAVGDVHYLTFHELKLNLDKIHSLLPLLYGLFLVSSLVRSGVFPFHFWVPKVYRSIPSNFVVLFIIMEGLGFYGLIRTTYLTLPPSRNLGYIIAALGTLSTFATAYAFKSVKLKRKMAYHSIMDIGFAYLALGIGMILLPVDHMFSTMALFGALLHVLYQIVYKSSIYLFMGSLEYIGTDPDIFSIKRIYRGITFVLAVIPVLSLSAVPPFAAFTSKWLVYQSALASKDVLIVLMFSFAAFMGSFSLASFINLKRMLDKLYKEEVEVEEIPTLIRLSQGVLAAVALILGPISWMEFSWLVKSLKEIIIFPPTGDTLEIFLPITLFSVMALAILFGSLILAYKIGKMQNSKISELLLIFYNIGDILRDVGKFLISGIYTLYINYLARVITEIPKSEIINSIEDLYKFKNRYLDELVVMPFLRFIQRLVKDVEERVVDMNALLTFAAVGFALLIIIFGVGT
ncbi:sodium:proton antiporter [Thermococcus sp. M39]|uniref:complex I subunit 5 family protein n=1 Tax=Thermococcus sp. M39 TaxID=1638262 RepID=UPI00143BA34D|nr:complex I subunit 5 family protein [Thermococcus sp. M39]NJE07651.1 sodium:proton antiporter [Thermococcus sp. M39]